MYIVIDDYSLRRLANLGPLASDTARCAADPTRISPAPLLVHGPKRKRHDIDEQHVRDLKPFTRSIALRYRTEAQETMGLQVFGIALDERCARFGARLDLQLGHDGLRDFILYVENVEHFTVVAIRPKLDFIGNVDQLRCNPAA